MIRWKQQFFILLILAITLTLVGPVAAQPAHEPARIQPQLLEISNTSPDRIISVIVQRNPGSFELEKRIARLGNTGAERRRSLCR